MERRCFLVAALAISVVPLTQAYAAEEQKPRVPGIYSDLAYSNEGGDLLGTEIFIIPIGNSEYVAFFQCWGGESTQPVTVPVKVSGDAISFTVRLPSCGVGAYKGRISKNAFDATVTRRLTDGSSKTEPVHLEPRHVVVQHAALLGCRQDLPIAAAQPAPDRRKPALRISSRR
jgi:hypothetical protein